ncbi:MAG: flagellar biosynthesis anti-sigma factor FlgM [Planctomycetota bacterium]
MTDIAPLGRSLATASLAPSKANGTPVAKPAAERGADQAQVSDQARFLAKLAELPPVREDVVGRVKTELQNGAYETPERLDAAVDALFGSGDLD